MDDTLIFVFASNLAGRHGRGSAFHAKTHFGAVQGVGEGRTGMAYAIPTKDAKLYTLPLNEIWRAVTRFLSYAAAYPALRFEVVAIGCGLAGLKPEVVAPMFRGHTANVHLPIEFWGLIHTGVGANERVSSVEPRVVTRTGGH